MKALCEPHRVGPVGSDNVWWWDITSSSSWLIRYWDMSNSQKSFASNPEFKTNSICISKFKSSPVHSEVCFAERCWWLGVWLGYRAPGGRAVQWGLPGHTSPVTSKMVHKPHGVKIPGSTVQCGAGLGRFRLSVVLVIRWQVDYPEDTLCPLP